MADIMDELLAAMAARYASDEERWRKENPGKVRFYLLRARDESPILTREWQSSFREVLSAIRDNHINVDAPFIACDAIDAVSGYTGELAVLIQAVSPVLTGILGAWLQSKTNRKVRLKVGDIEVEANTVSEVDQLLQHALSLQGSHDDAKQAKITNDENSKEI